MGPEGILIALAQQLHPLLQPRPLPLLPEPGHVPDAIAQRAAVVAGVRTLAAAFCVML